MRGNPPPLGSVSGHSYPSGLLVDWAPWRPLELPPPTFCSKSAKSDFGPPRSSKNVVHVCKSATWTIWERQSAKSATFCTFAILTSQIEQKRRTRMQKRESDFLKLSYFFEKNEKSFTF